MAWLPPETLESLVQGDDAARVAFWRAVQPRVEHICRQTLGDPHEARDLAAEVLVDFMFEYAAKLENPAAAPNYVYLMAMRRAQRHAQRRGAEVPAEALPERIDQNRQPDELADGTWVRQRLQGCLQELRPKARQALVLHYGKGHSNQLIGSLLGGSKQYIGRLLRDSLALMRLCIERSINAPQDKTRSASNPAQTPSAQQASPTSPDSQRPTMAKGPQ